MSELENVFGSVLRQDLGSFVRKAFGDLAPAQPYRPNWHVDAMAWHLTECFEGRIKRLLITLPPRYLKSVAASVAFPAWVLGRDPAQRIICASYSADLAAKHAGDCRLVMASEWYKRAFPRTRLSPKKNTELNFVTTQRGYRYSTSVGGTLTGRGGNLIIVDDPMKPEEAMSETRRAHCRDWFDRTLYTRLDNKSDDVIILIMQRLHIEDLAGHVLESGDWTHLCLPATAEIDERIQIGLDQYHLRRRGELLHPARESKAALADLRANLGSFAYAAQYQQSPVPEDGEIVKWQWFRTFDQPPWDVNGGTIVQSWDTASKADELNDYSVCTTWIVHNKHYFLIDVFRGRLNYPDLKRKMIQHAQHYQPRSLLIEDKGSGTSLIQDLRAASQASVPYPIAIEPKGDKLMRMSQQSATIEAGQVFVPREAPWLADFRSEILQFPNGRYDDQVDSVSQFLNWNFERNRYAVGSGTHIGMF